MKEYIASEVGVEDGEIIASSKGLHLYNYVWELAECLRGKTMEEFRRGQ
jgi:thymidylate synthase